MRARPVLVAACLTAGCCFTTPAPGAVADPASGAAATDTPQTATTITLDGPFVYADVGRAPAEPPARFSAPWPGDLTTLVGQWPASAPPREQAERRLCGGEPAAMRAWVDALERASSSTTRERLIASAEELVEYCDAPALCARGREAIAAGATGLARDAALLAIAGCGEPSDAALLDADGAPAAARIRWLERRCGLDDDVRAHERATPGRISAARTLIELAVEGDFTTERRARSAAMLLAAMEGGPEALRALAPELAPHPRALLLEVLASTGDDPLAPADLVASARDPEALASASPAERARLADESEACAREGGFEGRTCLEDLAAIDRARAVALARELGETDEALAGTVQLLLRFPERGALEAHLRELGLVGADCTASAAPADVGDAMMACGRSAVFDPETGTYPVHHDALLAQLALLAPGALDDVVFDEVPPAEEPEGGAFVVQGGRVVEEPSGPRPPYRLHAYSRGERFEVDAQDLDDWYDLEAALALLDTVARARGSDVRWLVVEPSGGNVAIVVAGPERGLRSAIDEQLLTPVSAGASEDARAAEHDLIRGLIERGEL